MNSNFLLGRGEVLTYPITVPPPFGPKAYPYTFEEAFTRLESQFQTVSEELDRLPSEACPNDYAVELLTLHPAFIAKSYYPNALLTSLGLQSIGSRNVIIKPEKWTRKGSPEDVTTTQLYVTGPRMTLRSIPQRIRKLGIDSPEVQDFCKIESVTLAQPLSSDLSRTYSDEKQYFEIGLHLLPTDEILTIERSFKIFATSLDIEIFDQLSFRSGNLWFIPAFGKTTNIRDLAKYVFIRVIRPMPQLRSIPATIRTSTALSKVKLPDSPAIAQDIRVAILDGGLPQQHRIGKWVNQYILSDPDANDIEDYNDHGLAVASAFLFGPLKSGEVANNPYTPLTHIRILDDISTREDPLQLYRTLGFIEEVLLSRQFQFINLSLGPDLPIEDQDVHAWTSVIDDKLSDGQTFMSIAVGNNGDLDQESGNARIQVPADCVNAVSVGAASSEVNTWSRASYSAIGPGRCPGIIKPDVLAFGGETSSYFHVLSRGTDDRIIPQLGTSFASPYLLRTAVGIRALLGDSITPLGIKSLLVHLAEQGTHERVHVGWGRIETTIEKYYQLQEGTARIVYQGELRPGKYLRAPIPLPTDALKGMITIHATICYASEIDPEDPGVYTRSGLEITFRPNKTKLKEKAKNSDTKSFFERKAFQTEDELRSDTGKWETVLNAQKRFRSTTLSEPCFDIHYNARANGGKSTNSNKLRYALIVTISAPEVINLHEQIMSKYPQLLPIQPRVIVPVKV